MRKILIALLALLALTSCAYADTYNGTVVACDAEATDMVSGVTVKEVMVQTGDRVNAGDVLCTLRTHTVFCEEDGTASVLMAQCGDEVDGTVLEVSPKHLYHLYCSTDDAYDSEDCRWIRPGETLYAKCISDGSHRAIVKVYSVSGEDFEAYSLGGELFIGETLNLYRSSTFTYSSRVGVATAVAADTVTYEAKGFLTTLDVEVGESVSRGEKLFTWCEAETPEIVAETSGIITELYLEEGHATEGTVAAMIVSGDALRLELTVNEADLNTIRAGGSITYTRADDASETPGKATLESVSSLSEGEGYRVRLIPEEKDLPIGLSVEVTIEQEEAVENAE